ncbi:unnamed protein product [Cunninghamella blakesleeana]
MSTKDTLNKFPRLHFSVEGNHDRSLKSLITGSLNRDLKPDSTIIFGRHSDKGSTSNSIIFKSKVISRLHAEVWVNNNGEVFIRDTKSSTGTFVNSKRLSPAHMFSQPIQLKNDDLIRLGTNYHGGHMDKYRSVTLRIHITYSQQINCFQMDECCICLYSLAPYQALFVTPCQHLFHFKCCKPLLDKSDDFQCPLCRRINNLETDVDE